MGIYVAMFFVLFEILPAQGKKGFLGHRNNVLQFGGTATLQIAYQSDFFPLICLF